jgi:RNA polymerase sigma factor (sigma-70 family)
MDALISAQAGVALLIHGTDLASIHASAPEQAIPRRAEEVHLLFGEAQDLQVLQDVDREQVARRLMQEAATAEALQLSLILLDHEMSEEIRREAAEELDGLLAEKEHRKKLECVFYAHSLPVPGDISGALALAENYAPRVHNLLRRLADLQPFIAEARRAWIGIPDMWFANPAERSRFHAALVREGLFRNLVIVRSKGIPVESFAALARLNPGLKKIHGYRTVIHALVRPFREEERKSNELSARPAEEVVMLLGKQGTETLRLLSTQGTASRGTIDRLPASREVGAVPLLSSSALLIESQLSQEEFSDSLIPKAKHLLAAYRIPQEDAKDIVQRLISAFIDLRDKIPIRDKEAWLLGTLRRYCLFYWRSQRHRLYAAVDAAVLEGLSRPDGSPQERAELLSDLDMIIERLPSRYRSILRLRYGLEYEPKEVAHRLGYSESGIGKVIRRCLAALYRELLAAGLLRLKTGDKGNNGIR